MSVFPFLCGKKAKESLFLLTTLLPDVKHSINSQPRNAFSSFCCFSAVPCDPCRTDRGSVYLCLWRPKPQASSPAAGMSHVKPQVTADHRADPDN